MKCWVHVLGASRYFLIPSAVQDASASEQKVESISAKAGVRSPISAQSWHPIPSLAGSVLIQKPLITSSPRRAKIGCVNLISRGRSSKDPLEDINLKDGTSFV